MTKKANKILVKPFEPSKPFEPDKYWEHRAFVAVCENCHDAKLVDILNEFKSIVENNEKLTIDDIVMNCDDYNVRVGYYENRRIENKSYKKQFKEYEAQLKKYEEQMVVYEKKLRAYNAQNDAEKKKKLDSELSAAEE